MRVNFNKQDTFCNLYSQERIKSLYGNFTPLKSLKNDSVCIDNYALKIAIKELEKLQFDIDDINKIKRYGGKLIFKNGKEAVSFAREKHIPIIFGKVDRPDIHAQWVDENKTIIINDRYKDTKKRAEILAISAAILHELSHAKDNDGISSLQEEIECLGMNALAFSVFRKENPELLKEENAPIIKDGVNVYTNLFLGNDKKALAARIREKYGDLPLESPYHKAERFAHRCLDIR